MKIFVPAMGRVNTQNRDGSGVRFAEIAKEWTKRGEELHILLPQREVTVLKNQGLEANFHILSEPIKSEKDNLFNILSIYLVRIFQSLFVRYPDSVDVIYVPSDFLVDLFPAIICKIKNRHARMFVCLFLVAPHPFKGYENVYSNRMKMPSLRELIYYFAQRISIIITRIFHGKILVLNSIDKKRIVNRGMREEDVFIVSMGVRVGEYERIIPEPNLSVYDAIFVGRLHPQKGLFDLIKIWKMVCEKNPGSRLAIVGGGSKWWFDKLNKEIEDAGLKGNIDILGFKDGEEKIKLLKSAKCFVMPSHYESWGMVIIEAMACGLPVVAYDLLIFKEIFKKGMVRIDIEDIISFSKEVLSFILDSEKRRRYMSDALSVARKYDWQIVAEREMEILKRD